MSEIEFIINDGDEGKRSCFVSNNPPPGDHRLFFDRLRREAEEKLRLKYTK